MNNRLQTPAWASLAASLAFAVLAGCSNMMGSGSSMSQKLSGDQEVPPVSTMATGTSTIKVAADGSVSGAVTTSGVEGTMAHIHVGAAGVNGPVILPLTKAADGSWTVPAGAKLTPEQMKSYESGGLYVNVHSAANKAGEIRTQLKP